MAGHNKWSKIKHRKKIVDGRRSKVWTKCVKAIMVAARNGPDPDMNLALRYAVDEAKYANVPKDTIERAIKKGSGELGAERYETVRYEGYAPGGVAVVIDALTDNRTRTAGDVRNTFSKHEGNLGATGCVGFLFEHKGRIVLTPTADVPPDPESVMDLALEAGANDVRGGDFDPDDPDAPPPAWELLTDPTDFLRVRSAVEALAPKARLKIDEAALAMIPTTVARVDDQETAERILDLVEALESFDDVQKVYTNLGD
ncbi:MAG: YebC/PmpR family DNA-binding transcriptional regulator [Phycisphaeraceae bacterium]|nr:YebC/PmpR family DNA-binding transcriptional regulator [Phycisphaeraceae bacterium]